ncbi:MAG: hypothetical protein KGR68_02120 [Betaproteobacteria bacterium]|nr:hypothetical protein [Betaproteobacteria bacterium]
MNPKAFRRSALQATLAVSLAASLLVSGCSDTVITPGELELNVSSGYPIVGATVTLKGANGATLQTAGTSDTGSVTISRHQAMSTLGFGPYLVQSTGGKANGVPVTEQYFSVASGDAGRTNVTPITHLIAVEATGTTNTNGIKTLFSSGFDSAKAQQLTSAKLTTAKTSVNDVLKSVNPRIDLSTYDPLSASFKFGDAIDSQLDYLKLALRSTSKSLDDVQGFVAKAAKKEFNANDVGDIKPIKRVIAFGDSLTDGGTYTVWASFAASGQPRFDPATPLPSLESASIWGGKFTTNPGKVWVEHLAASYGYAIKPAMLMGGTQPSANLLQLGCSTCTNYAQGGSRVALQPGIGNRGTAAGPSNYDRTSAFNAASTIPVKEQIDIHLGNPGEGKFKAGDLVLVFAGANDIFIQAQSGQSQQVIAEAVGAAAMQLAEQAARLKAANASSLVVIGLPDMGKTPSGAASGAASAAGLSALSLQVFNGTLAAALKAQNIVFVDPNEILTAVLTKPADYGFKVTIDTDASKALASTACGINQIAAAAQFDDPKNPSSLYCSTPNATASNVGTLRAAGADATYVFADGVHPSSQTHKVLADYLGSKLPRLLTDAMPATPK